MRDDENTRKRHFAPFCVFRAFRNNYDLNKIHNINKLSARKPSRRIPPQAREANNQQDQPDLARPQAEQEKNLRDINPNSKA
ncbi:MAG: hypothetical protein K5864_05265 [Bacteroidales bacterium]|nr:hypothetical protein [Bacteroidales bacterium]